MGYEMLFLIYLQTLSSKDKVAFSAPSGRPKGKQYLQKEDVDRKYNNSGKKYR